MDIIFVSLSVAGAAVLWRNILRDWPALSQFLRNHTHPLVNKSLQCGFCFTYWIGLIAVTIMNPLSVWAVPFRFYINPLFSRGIHFILSWMIVGIISVTVRFFYVILQETVHYFVHHINPDPNHHH